METLQSLSAGSSTMYGVVLNDYPSLQKFGNAVNAAPYKTKPKAPVMYIKPANTIVSSGATVYLPAGEKHVEIGATVGVVIGAPATRLTPATVNQVIAGYVLVADLSLPHDSYYRPAIREKCFDSACPIGQLTQLTEDQLEHLSLSTWVDNRLVQQRELNSLIRKIPQLLVDISAFNSLQKNDVVLVGVTYMGPQASVGSELRIEASRLGKLTARIALYPGHGEA